MIWRCFAQGIPNSMMSARDTRRRRRERARWTRRRPPQPAPAPRLGSLARAGQVKTRARSPRLGCGGGATGKKDRVRAGGGQSLGHYYGDQNSLERCDKHCPRSTRKEEGEEQIGIKTVADRDSSMFFIRLLRPRTTLDHPRE